MEPFKVICYFLLGIVSGCFLGYTYGMAKGASDERLNISNETFKVYEDAKKNVQVKKDNIRNISDAALIKRYCASSVYDIPQDECVRKVTYVK